MYIVGIWGQTSRWGRGWGDWRLYPQVGESIWRRFGQLEVDVFALEETTRSLLWFAIKGSTAYRIPHSQSLWILYVAMQRWGLTQVSLSKHQKLGEISSQVVEIQGPYLSQKSRFKIFNPLYSKNSTEDTNRQCPIHKKLFPLKRDEDLCQLTKGIFCKSIPYALNAVLQLFIKEM